MIVLQNLESLRMKNILLVTLLLLPLAPALADFDDPNVMGMFFSGTEFSDATTGIHTPGAPFNAYIVVLNPEVEAIGGYEVGISISDPTVFVLSTMGPDKWANEGDSLNQIVRFGTPVVVVDSAAILCTVQLLYSGTDLVEICFGPADPPGIPGHEGPVIVDGANLDIQESLIPCWPPFWGDLVAVLNPEHGSPVQTGSLSQLKALFY